MRARKLTLAAVALAAGLSLTACQGNEDSAAGTNDDSSAASSSSSSSGGDSQASGKNASDTGEKTAAADAAEGTGHGQINTGPCKTANLAFGSAHGMGEGTLIVSMKNTGDACSLKGFPGVDLRSEEASGPLSAHRSNLASPSVVLGNGETTRFTVHYPPNTSGGSGVDVTSLDITPPNETHSTNLKVGINLPVSPDTELKVTVDPVGTGKQ
ncbi:DUF4232 domain-containing protein [Streptomyces endophyticus]|uniref:DUF4232 domain-containing protein n=1 Tax=Streptomyces endophyticus TaxID=714166 RepID=A0ABU6F813_9ACTN|nr:DUF4232 domain-containing protein [Streptomyces endophyticus]MEB8339797.1 DUF4232 domain-containing protein [Streptomyces endophyticus]